jgi:hypothetical protein
MIVTRLEGGLGNQLFQYAVGKAVSLRTAEALAFDIREFDVVRETDTRRKPELHSFGLKMRIASRVECNLASGYNLVKAVLPERVIRRVWGRAANWVCEKGPESIEIVRRIGGSSYLSGYWQSEEYFSEFRNEIRNEIYSGGKNLVWQKEIANKIASSASVSLHIRRGDYVANPLTNAFHGTCSAEYYDRAVALISERVKEPCFYVFSDDIEWCRTNLHPGPHLAYVGPDASVSPAGEMMLMSMCRHNIIANSSFSWWGAWLNQHESKIVVAPRKWFNVEDPFDMQRIPSSWIRL